VQDSTLPDRDSIDATNLFSELTSQMMNTRLPAEDVEAMRKSIQKMWQDEPRRWVRDRTTLGGRYADEGAWFGGSRIGSKRLYSPTPGGKWAFEIADIPGWTGAPFKHWCAETTSQASLHRPE
jgi:hypothetical protein